MSSHSLSEAHLEQYRREGYVVVPSVFAAEELEKVYETIRTITREAVASGDPSQVLELEPEQDGEEPQPRRIYDPFERHEDFRALATDARVLDRIETLIGKDINLHHSKLNMKPARVGSVVEWHQDLAYFPHTNDDLVTTLIYLDEATVENGCLQVLPRHHHHYFDHAFSDGSFAGMITEDLSDNRYGRPESLPAPAGSVIFMHCMLPHSSLPNRSDRARRTLIFEYRAADSFPIYYGKKAEQQESRSHQLRGEPVHFARLGGAAPYIPKLNDNKSLYALQAEAKDNTSQQANKLPSLAE